MKCSICELNRELNSNMHRLLNARNIYPGGLHSFPIQSSYVSKASSKIQCSFCRKILNASGCEDNIMQIRHQSTRTASALQKSAKKKVKYKSIKKYGEVLEVSNKTMTESKVSISKLNADYLSKLTSSTVSLGQLHQLTKNTKKNSSKLIEVDPELLQSIKNKILKKSSSESPTEDKEINFNDDCALIYYTSQKITNIENRFKSKQYLDLVKESYYNFRKSTLYEQKLSDLRLAINEGIDQEFDVIPSICDTKNIIRNDSDGNIERKGAHAVFRKLFLDKNLNQYDQELMSHLTRLQTQGVPDDTMDDLMEEISHNDLDCTEESPELTEMQTLRTLNIAKVKKEMKAKRKAFREKNRAIKEVNMRNDMATIERRGKFEALHNQLTTHFHLLCSLGMLREVRQIFQHYRTHKHKMQDNFKMCDVKIYNILLHGYASQGLFNEVEELVSFMESDSVEGNAQTFAAIFESIQRSQLLDKRHILNIYYKKMNEKGISLNDLLDKSKFVKDQRETVLEAIRTIDPFFEPVYTPSVLDYECPLLDKLKLDDKNKIRSGLNTSPAEGVLSLEQLKLQVKKQFEIEIKGEIEVQNIDRKSDPSDTVKLYSKKLEDVEQEWREVVKEAFIRNLNTLKSQSAASHSPITLYPYLKVLDVNQFVDMIISEVMKLVDGSESYSPTLKTLQRALGTQVYNKYQIEQYHENGIKSKLEKLYDKYCEWYLNRQSLDGKGVPYNCRQAWQVIMDQNREGPSLDMEELSWPVDIRLNIGKFLYNIIIHDVKIDVNMFKQKNTKPKKMPAMYKVHRPWGRLVRLEIKPHPLLARLWLTAARPALRMRSTLLPLTCPAAPWVSTRAGAYLLTSTQVIRIPFNMTQQQKRMDEASPATLYPVFDSLNQVGEVPWVINKNILDLQLKIFRSGGNKKLDIPQPPSALDTFQFTPAENSKAAAYRRRVAINRARSEMYSLWCDALYKLSLANHYRDQIFWLPHNMDFRGRVYACPPHLSQLGSDTARALLKFAKPEPLGPDGLRWLKLHVINLTGTMKKQTLDQRLAHVEQIMDKILDSADRPLDGKMWWAKSEEPWQTLACCMEIANAVRSPNPEEYMCGFPVHQDGSCNGLQHYAALGGDVAGATAVNLAPVGKPQDVYSAVAALVEEMRVKDAAEGVPAAILLENFVKRKVIKQTVMTTVYGVTKFGARLQIAKQLKDIDDFPKDKVWTCSSYLTVKTFDSLREMFTSTKYIQDWFTDCAKLISGVCGESVEWVTPLGLPVVQPYFQKATSNCNVPLDQTKRPCTMKQKNAFPPNFIHSLDASHMMLTALYCQAHGITFVSVHDCFWTHPNTVHIMNKICREQFVALHSQPILDDLSEFLVKRYSYNESEIDEESKTYAAKKQVNELLKKVPEKAGLGMMRKILSTGEMTTGSRL